MFEQTFLQSQAKTRKPWTVGISLSLQCLAVGIVLLIPLLHPENLRMPGPPQPHLIRTWISQPPVPPQRTTTRTSAMTTPAAPRQLVFVPTISRSTAPPSIEVPVSDAGSTAWAPVGTQFGPTLANSVALPSAAIPKPVAQPTPKPVVPTGPIRVSTTITAAKLIYGPKPAYPRIAIISHSQGIVKLEATIAEDGTIRDLRVVSGSPLLVNAALDAVRQWRYHPTLLNGTAVQVLTEIDVNFTLSR